MAATLRIAPAFIIFGNLIFVFHRLLSTAYHGLLRGILIGDAFLCHASLAYCGSIMGRLIQIRNFKASAYI